MRAALREAAQALALEYYSASRDVLSPGGRPSRLSSSETTAIWRHGGRAEAEGSFGFHFDRIVRAAVLDEARRGPEPAHRSRPDTSLFEAPALPVALPDRPAAAWMQGTTRCVSCAGCRTVRARRP